MERLQDFFIYPANSFSLIHLIPQLMNDIVYIYIYIYTYIYIYNILSSHDQCSSKINTDC